MNISSGSRNVTMNYRDHISTAVTKNVIIMALFISINYINGTLVHIFNKHQIFNVNPRYILFIHLVVNDMIQLTTSVTMFILSYAFFTINVCICCMLLMLAIFTTINTPLNLASMAVECYIAICLPLRHAQLCTIRRTYILIGLIWVVSVVSLLPDLFIFVATEPQEFFFSRVFCLRDKVFRNPYSLRKRDATKILFLTLVWLTLFYTYLRILFTAKAANADAKKARNTVLLHGFQLLLCMLNYIAHLLKQALLYLFPTKYADSLFACYIIIQILPRLISPIVYGLRDQTFRRYLKKYMLCGMNVNNHPQTALEKPS